MDKTSLVKALQKCENGSYGWALYFFQIDRRKKKNPYTTYKIRFKNDRYIIEYAIALLDIIISSQLERVEEIQEYTGENTKISCDCIAATNELIKDQWSALTESIHNSSDEEVKGRYNGYALVGKSHVDNEKSVVFLKMANPVINFKNRKSSVFKFTNDDELAEMSDDICRLYMNIDCFFFDGNIYSFNYKIEDLFHIEKTLKKIKEKRITEIASVDAFSDKEDFIKRANAYKATRTFITFSNERLERIKEKSKRKEFSKSYKIKLDKDKKFIFTEDEQVSALIQYLCFKLIQDKETEELYKASDIVHFDI